MAIEVVPTVHPGLIPGTPVWLVLFPIGLIGTRDNIEPAKQCRVIVIHLFDAETSFTEPLNFVGAQRSGVLRCGRFACCAAVVVVGHSLDPSWVMGCQYPSLFGTSGTPCFCLAQTPCRGGETAGTAMASFVQSRNGLEHRRHKSFKPGLPQTLCRHAQVYFDRVGGFTGAACPAAGR